MPHEPGGPEDDFRRLADLSVGRDPALRQRALELVLERLVRTTYAHSATFVHRPIKLFKLAPVIHRHPRASKGSLATSGQIDHAFKAGTILASPDIAPMAADAPAQFRETSGTVVLPLPWVDKVVAVLALTGVPWIGRLSRHRDAECRRLFGILLKAVQEEPTPVYYGTTEMKDGKLVTVLHKYAVPPIPVVEEAVDPCPEILGRSAARRAVVEEIVKVAPTEATILILGETGSGKELVARAIHANSPRKAKPFVLFNLREINPNLIENELYGHEKGGFSGAHEVHAGILETAGEGTVLLDEIGDLSLSAQGSLLTVLQNRIFRRVGGTKVILLRARVLLATRRDLGKMVKAGLFREDLLFRVLQYPIQLLPLRARRDDIAPLITAFLLTCPQKLSLPEGFRPSIEPDAEALLVSLDWPGNVRELLGFLGFAVLSCMPYGITLASLRMLVPRWKRFTGESDGEPGLVEDLQVFLEAIRNSDGTTVGVADYLGITRQSSLERFKKFGLLPNPGRRRGGRQGHRGDGGNGKLR